MFSIAAPAEEERAGHPLLGATFNKTQREGIWLPKILAGERDEALEG
jgi:hypothetical protein